MYAADDAGETGWLNTPYQIASQNMEDLRSTGQKNKLKNKKFSSNSQSS
jgi:hypothetical protein